MNRSVAKKAVSEMVYDWVSEGAVLTDHKALIIADILAVFHSGAEAYEAQIRSLQEDVDALEWELLECRSNKGD